VSLGVLALIVLAGLAGPLLGVLGGRAFVPVVIGELLAGVIVGRTGFHAVDPASPAVALLGEAGFAMLMFTVGMHVPLRDRRLAGALRSGAYAAILVAVMAPLGGLAVAALAGTSHGAVYAVLLASGSAAVVVPALQERGLEGPGALVVIAQVTIADVATIVVVPLVLQPGRAGRAALGGLLVVGCALAIFVVARWLQHRDWVHRVRKLSKHREWALDLRLSLLVLFALAWIAQKSGTSVLIAGFGAGLMVAAIGGPKRLSTQVRGVAQGFFVPLFFVVLGAQLDLTALAEHARLLALAGTLTGLTILIHVIARALTRQPLGSGLIAVAQLGVPAAVVQIGLHEQVITAAEGAAIMVAALASLVACAIGVSLLARETARANAR
jgi:Kef-type K+ transport system membrane component KefB